MDDKKIIYTFQILEILGICPILDPFGNKIPKFFLWSINNQLRWSYCYKALHYNWIENKKVKIWKFSPFWAPFIYFSEMDFPKNFMTFHLLLTYLLLINSHCRISSIKIITRNRLNVSKCCNYVKMYYLSCTRWTELKLLQTATEQERQ